MHVSIKTIALGVVLGLAGSLVATVHPAVAAPLAGLTGEGTASDPVRIDSAEDLDAVSEAVNTDFARYGSLSYRLDADVDYDGKNFAPMQKFSGTLDGNGHAIRNLHMSATDRKVALIIEAAGATVKDLTLEQVEVAQTSELATPGRLSGAILVETASNAVIEGNSILDSSFTALTEATNSYAAALVRGATGSTILRNNYLDGVTVTAPTKYVGGIAFTASGTTAVSNNLVRHTRITQGAQGSQGQAAYIVTNCATTGVKVRGNAVHSGWLYQNASENQYYYGWITAQGTSCGYQDNLVNSNNNRTFGAEGHTEQPVRTRGTGTYDLAWDSDADLVSTDARTWTRGNDGTATTPAKLAQQATYEGIGWSFADSAGWRWEPKMEHPVPRKAQIPHFMRAGIPGSGTVAAPYQLDSAEDLEAMRSAIAADFDRYGAASYRLTADIDFAGATFAGLDAFAGVLDGNGHAISDLVLAPSEQSDDLGLIRELSGTVRSLTLARVSLAPVAGTDRVAAVAVTAEGTAAKPATVTQVQLRSTQLIAPNATLGAGLVVEGIDHASIHDNAVAATITVSSSNGLAAGVVGRAAERAIVKHNLVTPVLSAATTQKIVGQPAGPAAQVIGNVVVGDDSDGLDEHQKSTYSQLRWDFVDAWMWDLVTRLPHIKYVAPEEMPNRITTTFHGDPQTRRAFTWYQNIAMSEPGAIVSTDPTFPEDATLTFDATAERSNEDEALFRVVATGLSAGQTYYYRVGDLLTGKWGKTGTFETADGDDDFSFIGLTDTQARGGASEALVSANTIAEALKTAPDAEFLVHAGDVVQTSEEENDWIELFAASQESLLATTIAPIAGNHDAGANEFTQHFTLDGRNGQDTTTGVYYSYDYNDAHFVMVNTNEGRNGFNATGIGDVDFEPISDEQMAWIERDVNQARERGAKWIILTTHRGPYTAGGHAADPDILSMRDRLVPLIDTLDIDLVLQGHDHYWSRTRELVSDPGHPTKAKAVESDVITEVIGGVKIDYKVEQDGTVYVSPGTAGAKHYGQLQGITDGQAPFSNAEYLDLFDRLGGGLRFTSNTHESFLEVEVTDGRLTVNRHEVGSDDKARFAEGFGIDRSIAPIDAALAALPKAADVALADEPAISAARAAVQTLTKVQRGHLANLDRLIAAENALRELLGTASPDDETVAWADPEATVRQPITVTNDQRRDLSDVPVRLAIENTPDVPQSTFALTTSRSVPVSFEIETWVPGGTSVVWAKVDDLSKRGTQMLWAYFGGRGATTNDPRDVWSKDFTFVEHFANNVGSGSTLVDSTGRETGTLVGADLVSSIDSAAGLRGGGSVAFANSRLQYATTIGDNTRDFTMSAVLSMTQADVDALRGGTASLLARTNPNEEDPALQLGIRKADGAVQTLTPYGSASVPFPKDGAPHVVTVAFDGLTYAIFLDGTEVHSIMAEGRQFPKMPGIPLTIGDIQVDPEDPNRLVAPFVGVIDEIWIANTEFIPELDAFRADNYFGDAVRIGTRESKSGESVVLALGATTRKAAVEAGAVEVFGTVSKRSDLTARIDGEVVFTERVAAGNFTIQVPVMEPGEGIEVVLTAAAAGNAALVSEPSTLTLDVVDTVAPAVPATSTRRPANEALKLEVSPQTELPEKVSAQFYVNESVALDASNLSVRTGSTKDRVPDALTPTSGSASTKLTPETVGDDENPYQLYRITLTEDQADDREWHFSWRGAADTRTVSAWVWNTQARSWVLKESTASPEGDTVNLDVRATEADHPVDSGRTMTVLIWRGLTELPWAESENFDTRVPSADDYDWSFNHVGDTQLYTEATPWTMTEQFEYIRNNARAKKTAMVIQAGDWVNREEYEDEWQWKDAEPSAKLLEESKIPFAISWGNHDYNENYTGRKMIPKYFPMERFAASLEGSPWSFGGSHDIDSYYYTGEIASAKILWLQLGYWSAERDDHPGLAWAKRVIEAHPDHTVILSTHHHLWARDAVNPYSNPRVNDLLIDPYPNVKLVLSGHQSGTFVSSRLNDHGERTFGILSDYQTRAWGGHGYLKNLSVDAENGLIYVNTYSPWLQRTTSEGRWSQPIPLTGKEGYHGENSENYVIELDLGGAQQRTIDTDRVTFASGAPQELGDPVALVGDQLGSVRFSPDLDVDQEWYAVLTDGSGNHTASKTSVVRRVLSHAISYDLAGGTIDAGANPETYASDDRAITLQNPTRAGYRFLGWSGTGIDGRTTQVTIPSGSAGDRSYVAHWEIREYRIDYRLDGGYFTGSSPRKYTVADDEIVVTQPRRTGFTFAGWIGDELTEPSRELRIPTGSVGDRSYTATWEAVGYPITYRLGGGSVPEGSNPGSYTTADEAFTLVNPTRPGYTFAGWIGTGLDRASTQVTVDSGTRGELSYTATWTALPRTTASVHLKIAPKQAGKKNPTQTVVTVAARSGYATPTGKVKITATGTVVKKISGKTRTVAVTRTRTVTMKNGKVTVTLPSGLSTGTWKVKATFGGDRQYRSGHSKWVTLKLR